MDKKPYSVPGVLALGVLTLVWMFLAAYGEKNGHCTVARILCPFQLIELIDPLELIIYVMIALFVGGIFAMISMTVMRQRY